MVRVTVLKFAGAFATHISIPFSLEEKVSTGLNKYFH